MSLINLVVLAQFGFLTLAFCQWNWCVDGWKKKYLMYTPSADGYTNHEVDAKIGDLLFHHTSNCLGPGGFWFQRRPQPGPFIRGYCTTSLTIQDNSIFRTSCILQTTIWHLICNLGNYFKHSSSTKSMQKTSYTHQACVLSAILGLT